MNSLRDSILIGAAMIGFVMGNCPLAQATPSQPGPNISGMMSDSSVWTWPVGKASPSKAANNVREVWTWPVSKEARSRVWTEARNPESIKARGQVWNKGQTAQWRTASRKSVFLGGL
jgi:hypothetical protein